MLCLFIYSCLFSGHLDILEIYKKKGFVNVNSDFLPLYNIYEILKHDSRNSAYLDSIGKVFCFCYGINFNTAYFMFYIIQGNINFYVLISIFGFCLFHNLTFCLGY